MTTTNNTTFEAGKSKQKKCQAIKSIKSHKKHLDQSQVSFPKTTFYNGECRCSRQQPK